MASSGSMPSSFDNSDFKEESRWEKFSRKLRQEPLIPFGTGLTCYALYRATQSMKVGDHHQTQRMFRARIMAQFFTILCIVGGSYYYQDERQKRKVFESAIAEKRAMEKRDAWIKELEARDQEDREIKAQKNSKAASRIQTPVSSALEDSERRKPRVVDAVKDLDGFGKR